MPRIDAHPGLQAQRTTLAWSRTVWAAGASALLIGRCGVLHAQPLLMALGAMVLCGACATLTLLHARQRVLFATPLPAALPNRWALCLSCGLSLAAAASAALVWL